jgi:hypothetical protein
MNVNDKIDKLIEHYRQVIDDTTEQQRDNFTFASLERIEMAREFISELHCLYQYETSTTSIG